MRNGTSLYLDFLRVFSAVAVFLSHVNFVWFSKNVIYPVNGHKFVIIFFSLSGYLIAYTTSQKKKDGLSYAVDRISRLYSVIIPALILTFILDNIGMLIDPAFYLANITPNHYFLRFLLTFFNLQEIGPLSSRPSINGPFWSLAYEFWYYAIFGIYLYMPASKIKTLIILFICVLFYKITLLFPIWLGGALAFNLSQKIRLSSKIKITGFLATFAIIFIFIFEVTPEIFPAIGMLGFPPLFYSADFLNDYMIGIIVALNLFFISNVTINVKSFMYTKVESLVKFLSSITFSLYLLHLPLLAFTSITISYNKQSTFHVLALLGIILVIISIIGVAIESNRFYLKRFLEKNIAYLKAGKNNN